MYYLAFSFYCSFKNICGSFIDPGSLSPNEARYLIEKKYDLGFLTYFDILVNKMSSLLTGGLEQTHLYKIWSVHIN